MKQIFRLALIFAWLASWAPVASVTAQTPDYCADGQQYTGIYKGGTYLFCIPPTGWNSDLVIYAHGYVSPQVPAGTIPEDQLQLPDGTYLPVLVNTLGYAFAMSSYRHNGLAVKNGVEDVRLLVPLFTTMTGLAPERVYLVGASEGGLITTLAVEGYPDLFTGGLAACGPVGDFRKQINHIGDFRVVFDDFFPQIDVPGSPIDIDTEQVWPLWESDYVPAITSALDENPLATGQLLSVSKAPIDPFDLSTIEVTTLGLLWYNVFATNDGVEKLGGNPFDNLSRWYFGSFNDLRLNGEVARFEADTAALEEIESYYQTSGDIPTQLVTIHTTGDPIVPYWHVPRYRLKVYTAGAGWHYSNIPIFRYGHCNFKPVEVLAAFGLLVLKSSGLSLQNVDKVLTDPEEMMEYQRLLESASQTNEIYLPLLLR